jgi:uncharacterized protein YkwD
MASRGDAVEGNRTFARRAIAVVVLLNVAAAAAAEARDGSTPVSVSASAVEREVFDLVNRHRRKRGLPSLVLDSRISRQARLHSVAMAAGSRRFGHDGYEQRVPALRRATSCGDSAENVAVTWRVRAPSPSAVRDWLASRGHRRNIEGRYESTGIGVASNRAGEVYFTQIFLGRCRSRRS